MESINISVNRSPKIFYVTIKQRAYDITIDKSPNISVLYLSNLLTKKYIGKSDIVPSYIRLVENQISCASMLDLTESTDVVCDICLKNHHVDLKDCISEASGDIYYAYATTEYTIINIDPDDSNLLDGFN